MQLKYLVGLCFVTATYALPAVECDTCHGGGGGGSGGSGGSSGGSGGGAGGGSGSSGGKPGGSCNTGPVQCCNQVQSAKDAPTGLLSLLGLLGVVLGANVPIGLGCSPISVIGVGGNSW
ncbi:hypothetical protein AAF712_008739 [Marasmius tenuissimus]|uniref:Hydrophobin n=1 Tax=Marasmius tenuissimus TaxID=585030 RepID=A0ABR2ZSN4_9AGAR